MDNHWPSDCRKCVGREERLKRLTELERCYLCLGKGHLAAECRSRRKHCTICNGRHHFVLCGIASTYNNNNGPHIGWKGTVNPIINSNKIPLGEKKPKKKFENKNLVGRRDNGPKLEDKKETANHLNVEEKETLVAKSVDKSTTILMTQRVPVLNPNFPNKVKEAIVFFDSGSQTSYISRKLARELQLSKVGETFLAVNSFRSKEPIRFKSPKYMLRMKLRNGNYDDIILNETEWMCKGFESINFDERYVHNLEGIEQSLTLIKEEPDIIISISEF